jgi:CheY-like chemotaxis protein
MSIALEGLFKKLLQDFKYCTSSTLSTLATGADLLKDLCARGMKTDLATNPPIHILIVDDDFVARRIIVGALQTIFEKPESVESGEAALALLVKKTFDVIFLDVIMQGMDGFEVCTKIRDTVPNRATPVVFVTNLENFDAHAKISGNNDTELMRKPFLVSEIIVKALVSALRGRLLRLSA